jgi:tRNA modification GTPase
LEDTIVALVTPPGISGIAMVRISGKDAIRIADSCFVSNKKIAEAKSHTILVGNIIYQNTVIDSLAALIFKNPHSFTGEDTVEFTCHGGYIASEELIRVLKEFGARLAEPGEFTKRAFLNGKMDLTQVEAVADIIHSISAPACQISARQLSGGLSEQIHSFRKQLINILCLLELELDFADEELEFVDKSQIIDLIKNAGEFCNNLANSFRSAQILRNGFYVAISGYPNSGKSTLLNTLLKKKRSIVSDIPGTTRDYIEDTFYINQIPVKLIDTAGLRSSDDYVEIEGIKMAESILEQADLNLIINDISISKENSSKLLNEIKNKFPNSVTILIQNKIDKINFTDDLKKDGIYFISAKQGIGLKELINMIENEANRSIVQTNEYLINERQRDLLLRASDSLALAEASAKSDFQNEIIAIDVRNAIKPLGELTGENWSEEVLNNIFSNFCIGK